MNIKQVTLLVGNCEVRITRYGPQEHDVFCCLNIEIGSNWSRQYDIRPSIARVTTIADEMLTHIYGIGSEIALSQVRELRELLQLVAGF